MSGEKWTSDCGTVTLYCGDCLEILPTLSPGSVDAVVTDPPYGVKYKGKTTKHSRRVGGSYESGDSDTVGPEFMKRWTGRAVVFPGTRIAFDYPKPTEMGFAYCPSGAG
jgi:DNA modification methylase